MTTMIPDLVVGEVGFGPAFATDALDGNLIADLRRDIAALQAEVARLTDPKNHENPQENP